ncbi:hypothetical protein [Kitasatospora sp. NPDC050463]|uniref:hypothetical protein n=1 Tax=Kitasatospora sp. NPDC050463 TaxID=3155786 RepID=UPI0033F650B2
MTRRLHEAVALSAALLLLALTVAVVLFVARIGQAVEQSRSPDCLGLVVDGARAGVAGSGDQAPRFGI